MSALWLQRAKLLLHLKMQVKPILDPAANEPRDGALACVGISHRNEVSVQEAVAINNMHGAT